MDGHLVAARYLDGHIVKGRTSNFRPTQAQFHVTAPGLREPAEIRLAELKAIFFIKTLEGRPEHEERKEFSLPGGSWSKVWIEFDCDGEELAGWTSPSLSSKLGFFLLPTDTESNIEKIYVPRSALKRVLKGAAAESAALEYGRKRPSDRVGAGEPPRSPEGPSGPGEPAA